MNLLDSELPTYRLHGALRNVAFVAGRDDRLPAVQEDFFVRTPGRSKGRSESLQLLPELPRRHEVMVSKIAYLSKGKGVWVILRPYEAQPRGSGSRTARR